MQAVEEFKTFLFRRRRIKWLIAAFLFIGVGQLLEAYQIHTLGVVKAGERLTHTLQTRLEAVQPNAISTFYGEAGAGRHGLSACGSTAAPKPQPTPAYAPSAPLSAIHPASSETLTRRMRELTENAPNPNAGSYWTCTGWLRTVDGAALTLRITPEVALRVWHSAGWTATIVFALTLGVILFALLRLWTKPNDYGCAVVPITLGILAMTPLIAGIGFWLTLKLLILLTIFCGRVLAGLAIVLVWVLGGWSMAMAFVGFLKTSDELEKNADLAAKTIDELRG